MIRVLIVDDKPDNLYLLRALLQGHGCAVDEARHGAEALVKAREAPPQLVIADLLMPVMDGYTLLRQWKADERLRGIPFVVYTATYTGAADERLALDLGADAFILKPAEPEPFMARIQEVLAKARRDELAPPRAPQAEEKVLLKEYSEVLVRKLEAKAAQLELANRALQEDLVRRQQGEAALRESEERLSRIVETSPDGIVILDRDGRITFANATAELILGSSRAQIAERRYDDPGWKITTPEGQPFPDEQLPFRRVMASNQPVQGIELAIEHPEGRSVILSVSAAPLRDAAGSPVGVVATATDITERKHAERELRDKAAALHEVTRHLAEAQAIARVGSWELDLPHDRSLWSAEMYRLFGRDPAAGPATVDEFLDLVHPDDRTAMRVVARRAQAGESGRIAFRTNPAHGPVRHLESTLASVARDGRVVLEGTTQDVTEHTELVERERRARALAETLSQANLALIQEADLETVLKAILDHLGHLVPYDSANVMLLENGRRLTVRAARGYERWTDASAADRMAFDPATNPIFEGTLSSGKPVLVQDSLKEPAWQRVAGAEHVRGWLGVPLVHQGRTIGIFGVDKTVPDFFTEEHGRLAQALAPAAATAIERARLLGELHEREARLRLAIDASNIGPWDWDLRTGTVYFSPEWKRQIGYREHEIQGRYEEWESRLHPADREPTLAALRAHMEGRRPEYEVEFRLRHKDGSYRWIYTRGEVLRGADGRPERMLGCHLDITERKRMEDALRESEERLRLFVRHAPAAIAMFDTQMRYVALSDRWLYRLAPGDLIGRSHYDVFPEIPERWRRIHERVLAGATERAEAEPFERGDGSVDWVRWEMVPWHRADGAVTGALLCTEVITERKRIDDALRESERQLSSIYGNVADIIIYLAVEPDEQYRFLSVNHAFLTATGLSEDQVKGKPLREVIPAPSVSLVLGKCREAVQGGKTSRWEETTSDPAGLKTGEVSVTPIFGAEGRCTHLVGTVRDITDRKRAEDELRSGAAIRAKAFEALRESEARYRSLFEGSRDALMTLAPPSWRFTAGNPATVKMFGARDEVDFVSRAPWEYSPEKQSDGRPSAAVAREMIETAMTTGSHSFDWTHRRLGGESFPAAVMLTRVEVGGQALLQATVRDMAERKAAEAERDRLALAIDQTGDAIIITDLGGAIQYVNPAFERTTGYSEKEAVGRNPRFLKSGEQDRALYGELWLTISGGRTWAGRLVNRRKDGTRFTAAVTISPVCDAGGRAVSYVAVERDITDQLLLEAQLRQVQKIEAIGQLAGGVAHDFNNILGVIVGYGELAQRQLGPGHPVRARVDQMLKAAARAASLTRQLLAFSRKQVMQPKLIDLNSIVADTQKMLGRVIGEDIGLVIHAAAGLGTVKADPGQIEQIILNLAVNARDAMPKGGSLTLETANADLDVDYAAVHPTATPGRCVMLAISDTGMGMDQETQLRIFEPFFTTKPVGEGTGLGLSTVYGIVKQSGGHILVYSEPGRGTTFKVYLPRVDELAETPALAGPPAEAPRGDETILLVEDTATLQDVIRETLEERGYTVLLALNGEEALALAGEHTGPIHLLLADVVMPKLGGGDLARLLCAFRPEIRVLFMSGYTAGAISQHGAAGADVPLLEKPFTADRLARAVREALDRPALGG